MKPLPLVLILILVAVLTASCAGGGGGAAAPTKGDVTVFVAGPLSGFQANTGQTVAGGVRLMAEQLNRSGGLLGYKVKVVALDDEADSDVAVGVAEQIKTAVESGEKVIGVIGHPNSGQTAAAMDIYKDLADHRHHADRVRGRPDAAGLLATSSASTRPTTCRRRPARSTW